MRVVEDAGGAVRVNGNDKLRALNGAGMLHRPGNPDALTQQMIDIVSQDGKIYGIPYIAYVMGMWYNVALFTEAGLVDENGIPLYPTTYDERIETAVTIKEKTGKSGFVMPTRDRIGGWFF